MKGMAVMETLVSELFTGKSDDDEEKKQQTVSRAEDFIFQHSDNLSLFLTLRRITLTAYKTAQRPKLLKILEFELFQDKLREQADFMKKLGDNIRREQEHREKVFEKYKNNGHEVKKMIADFEQ